MKKQPLPIEILDAHVTTQEYRKTQQKRICVKFNLNGQLLIIDKQLTDHDVENLVVNFKINGDAGLARTFFEFISKSIAESLINSQQLNIDYLKQNIQPVWEAEIERVHRLNDFTKSISP